jgi:hypothetical protein
MAFALSDGRELLIWRFVQPWSELEAGHVTVVAVVEDYERVLGVAEYRDWKSPRPVVEELGSRLTPDERRRELADAICRGEGAETQRTPR